MLQRGAGHEWTNSRVGEHAVRPRWAPLVLGEYEGGDENIGGGMRLIMRYMKERKTKTKTKF
jgi:hypothetical protein